ncbi:DUF427 domain-containing protein [Sulfitobacter sp. HNIBRBA3233]|uniref:DUF427 domain-containing protein n=1 Tax=Sulfitobacter marinivivus TaxID=3158558 RepID=UPI0032E054F3
MSQLPVENVQDYPRPPALQRVPHRLRVLLGGETVADTVRALRVLETHHAPTYYFPPEDIMADLVRLKGNSVCEWKGSATYFDVRTEFATAPRAAWSYHDPRSAFAPLAEYVSFYAGLMETCFVADERVIPQPGDFYGGWVTGNLQGTVKGARGTEQW